MAYNRPLLSLQERIRVLNILWNDSSLLGIVDHFQEFGQPWKKIDQESLAHWSYGYIQLEKEKIIGCSSYFLQIEHTSWFSLSIPLGLLGLVFPVHYPASRNKNSWMTQVDRVFATLAMKVYQDTPFTLGIIGEEAAAFPVEQALKDIARDPGLLVPERLFQNVGVTPYGLRSPEGLWWTGW